MAMSEQTKTIFNYVREHAAEDISAVSIAEAFGTSPRSVNGTLTALQKKGWIIREEVPVMGGSVKYIRLTEEGAAVDLDQEPVQD